MACAYPGERQSCLRSSNTADSSLNVFPCGVCVLRCSNGLLQNHRQRSNAGTVPRRVHAPLAQVPWSATPAREPVLRPFLTRAQHPFPATCPSRDQLMPLRNETIIRGAGCRHGHGRTCGSRGWATARGHPANSSSNALTVSSTDIPQMTSKFAEIVPRPHLQGHSVPIAAIR